MSQITFANKVTLVSQPDVARENKVIDDDMNEIKSVVNENAGMCEFSTSETNTGKTWIDGKTIYRKVINFGALPNNTEKNVNHNISNIGFITNMYGISYRSSDQQYINIPYTNVGSTNNARLIIKPTTISITATNDLSTYSETYVILEYTKTN